MADKNNVSKQDTMRGVRGEWYLYIVALFVVVALAASWAGGWWSDEATDVSAPVSTQPLTSQDVEPR
jgi:hypothetical protein